MNSRSALIVVLAGFALATVSVAVAAKVNQYRKHSQVDAVQAAPVPPEEAPTPLEPDRPNPYMVRSHPYPLASMRNPGRFDAVVAVLKKMRPVPDARIQFYKWLENEQSPLVFQGWKTVVKDVVSTPTGWEAEVWVSPQVLTKDETPAILFNRFVERYSFSNGELTFVGGHPRPGQSDEPAYVTF